MLAPIVYWKKKEMKNNETKKNRYIIAIKQNADKRWLLANIRHLKSCLDGIYLQK